METKIHYWAGTVQIIVRLSLARYQGYANTLQVIIDQLAAHLPPRLVPLVHRYGVYSEKVRY